MGSRTRAATKSSTASRSKARSKFHAYASACIVQYGRRYTLALTWVRRHESMVKVLRRLLARIREIGLKITLFASGSGFLQRPGGAIFSAGKPAVSDARDVPRAAPKKGQPLRGLQWIRRQPAGWYSHTMKNKKQEATFSVCVGYRRHLNRKDGKRKTQKLLFAAWRVNGSPTEIRERYRSVSASKRAIGKCGRHGSTPAHAIPICGCSSWRWR